MTEEIAGKKDIHDETIQVQSRENGLNKSLPELSPDFSENDKTRPSSVTTLIRCNHQAGSSVSCLIAYEGEHLSNQNSSKLNSASQNVEKCKHLNTSNKFISSASKLAETNFLVISNQKSGEFFHCSDTLTSRRRISSGQSEVFSALDEDYPIIELKPADDLKIIHHKNKFDLVFNPIKSAVTVHSSKASIATSIGSGPHVLDLTAEDSNLKLKYDKRFNKKKKKDRPISHSNFTTGSASDDMQGAYHQQFSSAENIDRRLLKADAEYGSHASDTDRTFRLLYSTTDGHTAPPRVNPVYLKPLSSNPNVQNGTRLVSRDRMSFMMRGMVSNMAVPQSTHISPRRLECRRINWISKN